MVDAYAYPTLSRLSREPNNTIDCRLEALSLTMLMVRRCLPADPAAQLVWATIPERCCLRVEWHRFERRALQEGKQALELLSHQVDGRATTAQGVGADALIPRVDVRMEADGREDLDVWELVIAE